MGRVVRVPTCSGGKLRTKPTQGGWQRMAVRQVEQKFIHEEVWPTLDDPRRALLRSQRGPLASAPLTALPTSRMTRIEALCRRLRCPFTFPCAPADVAAILILFGHHRAACHVAGVLGRRGYALECAAAQMCRESRGTGHDQHVCSRHGPGPLQRARRSKTPRLWQTGSHSGAGHSWPLIPPLFHR